MEIITTLLPYIQITLSIILIAAILVQHSEAGIGGALGGGEAGGIYHTRRGFEKFIFITTIVTSILFAISAIVGILVK
jgi:protein translocase SecG subunit